MAAGDLALRIIITASGSQAMAEIGMIAMEANRIAKGISQAGLIAAAGLVAVGIASLRITGDFEQQMNHIHALGNVSTQDTKMLSQALLAMAPAVAQGPVELAKAMFQVTSALFPAKQGLDIVRLSAIMASTGMADVVDVTKSMIVVMKNYGMDAKTAADQVTMAVSLGRMTMSDYANSIGVVVQKGKQAHASFLEINAAMDVLTSTVFPSAQQASRNLSQMFTQVGVNVDALAKRAQGLGLNFQENYYKTLPLIDKLEYLKKITGGNSEELNKLIGGGQYASRVVQALTDHVGMYSEILGKLQGATKGTGAAQQKWEESMNGLNVKMGMAKASVQVLGITIGTQLLPFIEPMIDWFAKAAVNVANWMNSEHPLNDILSLTGKYTQQVLPWIAALATTILILLVPAIITLVTSMSPLLLVALGVGAAVGGLTALFIHLYQTNSGFRAFIDAIGQGFKNIGQWFMTNVWPALTQFWQVIQTQVLPALQKFWQFISSNFLPVVQQIGAFFMAHVWPYLQSIGAFMVSTFTPVWQQLVSVWNSQMLPALTQLWGALQPLLPVLKFIGGVILAVVVVAIVVLITMFVAMVGVITAVIGAISGFLSGFLTGLADAIGGITLFITGIIQFISGFVTLIYDIIVGNWGHIGADLGMIWQGVLNIFQGFLNTMYGLGEALVMGVVGLVVGLYNSIVGWFQNLYNTLVGHSIVPDMVTGILSWISQLPGKGLAFITTMVSNIIGKLTTFASDGIKKITTFVTDMANKFASAARDALNWGAGIVNQILAGLKNAWSAVTNWLGGALAGIKNMFPHSPVKEGPLMGLENWGGNIVDNLVQGMYKNAPKLLAAANTLASSAHEPFQELNGFSLNGGSFALHSGNTIIIQPSQAGPVVLDKRQVGEILFTYQASEVRKQGLVRNR